MVVIAHRGRALVPLRVREDQLSLAHDVAPRSGTVCETILAIAADSSIQGVTERFILDLTGPGSHVLVRHPGDRGLTIGPTGCDLVVGEDDRVRWDALDAPELVADDHPRRVRYEGGDSGIAAWAARRGLGSLHVIATRSLDLDLSAARLQYLTLEPRGHRVTARLPAGEFLDCVTIVGDAASLTVVPHPDGTTPGVILEPPRVGAAGRRILPADGSGGTRALRLPPPLRGAETVRVYGDPFDVPFDARTLLELPRLRKVEIRGAVAHLDVLGRMPLTMLEMRYVPDLAGLPPLSAWPELDWLVVWNSDAAVTRRVASEIRKAPPRGRHRSASKGRSASWFAVEYGLPFGAWPRRTAVRATRAFADASKRIAGATTREECLAVVEDFVRVANGLPGIETSEREDLGEAVWLLSSLSEHLDAAAATARFDEVREF